MFYEHMQTPIGHEPSPERAAEIIRETLVVGVIFFAIGYAMLNSTVGPHTW
ncbi:hypothetical protein SEA_MUSETTA_71 [Microbacterium phage Musetta]|nr:hypothetical protein SEA_FORK_67 [Microbacterium phage Fork]AXH50279.1 hypothetical protein SEA_MUSETTA_71 [Microbacterium phage Musetta]QYC54190.1 hypothetical protein SEA_WELCOME_73 [Microbacterium phage Welcome]WNO25962.1 hypothetical protein SEA_ASEGATO_70 [Microbacterium phage ASegato]